MSRTKVKGQHPLMASTRRREREVVAVAFNQKEQRVLEKSLATLRLEASYSLKLLDLHNRSVKVHFRQMKDKVARIKSHLDPEEINELRQLEAEGKLHPLYPPVSLGSALKIAAASRRLHSSHSRRPSGLARAKSALPRVNLPDQGPVPPPAPPPGALKRSNSVTGVFMDVPSPRGSSRPGSASVLVVPGRTNPCPPSLTVNGVRAAPAVVGKEGSGPVSLSSRPSPQDSRQNRLQVNGSGGGGRPGSGRGGVRTGSSTHLQLQQNGSSSSSSMDSQQSRGSWAASQQQGGSGGGGGGGGAGRTATVAADSHPARRPAPGPNSVPAGQSSVADPARSRRTVTSAASTSQSRAATSHAHTHAPFSSHVATEKEARERGSAETGAAAGRDTTVGGGAGAGVATTPRSLYSSAERSTSFLGLQDDTVDDLGEDLFAERRAELLEEEQYRAAVITKRKDRFLLDIDQYLRDHPPLTRPSSKSGGKTQDSATHKTGAGEAGVEGLGGALFRRRRVEFDTSPTYLPEADYREKLMGLWRDMNKCRYLRVPDEMIDLSGVNTLATDTMKLFQVLKHHEVVDSVPNAWTE